jgi:hypothetical protein
MERNTTLTDILMVMTIRRRTTMICGNCSMAWLAVHFSCLYAYTMEYSALFLGRIGVSPAGLSVLGR